MASLGKTIVRQEDEVQEQINTKDLRDIAGRLAVLSEQHGDVGLTEEQRRWLVVGLATNTIVVPVLRPLVASGMAKLYNYLDTHQPVQLSLQTPQSYLRKHGLCTLEYRNINNNRTSIVKGKGGYDYRVKSHSDLARLFLQPHMAKFGGFDESCDASALLTLILRVDDFPCGGTFRSLTQTAQAVRDIRNHWAHCNLSYWKEATFEAAFNDMEKLIRLIHPNDQRIIKDLGTLKKNGTQMVGNTVLQYAFLQSLSKDTSEIAKILVKLIEAFQDLPCLLDDLKNKLMVNENNILLLSDRTTDLEERTLVLEQTYFVRNNEPMHFGPRHLNNEDTIISKYRKDLMLFNGQSLSRLSQADPQIHDPSKYIQLRIYLDSNIFREFGDHKEFEQALTIKGKEDISLHELFSASKHEDTGPRTVVMLGVPGSGKTLTFHYMLQEIVRGSMHSHQVHFVFAISLRIFNVQKSDISFRDLLLVHHGPGGVSTDTNVTTEHISNIIWTHLVKNQHKIIILLDGYDEVEGLGSRFDFSNTSDFTDVDKAVKPQVILHNIISGRIFPEAKVFVTSRPHCATRLCRGAHRIRIVHLDCFDELKLKQFIYDGLNNSPKLAKSLFQFIKERHTVLEFCKIPLHAKDLLLYIKRLTNGCKDTTVDKLRLPQSVAGLYFILDLQMLYSSDRDLQDKVEEMTDIDRLKKKCPFLVKLAKLASRGLLRKDIKQLFDVEDIAQVGLQPDELEGSIMTCSEALISDVVKPVRKRFFGFSHYTQQEHFTGIYCHKMPVKDVETIARRNKGEHDVVLLMYFGSCGDQLVNNMLSCVIAKMSPVEALQKALKVLTVVWTEHNRPGFEGEIFAMRCFQELQLDSRHVPDLKPPMYSGAGALDIRDYWLSASEQMCLANYLRHCPQATVRCLKLDILKHQELYSAVIQKPKQSVSGLNLKVDDDDMMSRICVLLAELNCRHALQGMWLQTDSQKCMDTFVKGKHMKLQSIWLGGKADEDNFTKVPWCLLWQSLSQCHGLLNMGLQNMTITSGTKGDVMVEELSSLTWLVMLRCRVATETMHRLMLKCNARGLWLKDCDIGDKGTGLLAQYLSSPQCRLHVLYVLDSTVTKRGWSLLCAALQGTKLKAVGLISPPCEEIGHVIMNSEVQEVSVSYDSGENITPLCEGVVHNTHLCLVDLSHSRLTQAASALLCEGLTTTTSVRSLIMRSCHLMPQSLQPITSALKVNSSVKLLDICLNRDVDADAIVAIIQNTELEVLDVRECGLYDESSSCQVAQALCSNTTIHTLGFGYSGLTPAFLTELTRVYPPTGPLHTLVMFMHSNEVRLRGWQLQQKLRKPSLIFYDNFTDIALLTGHRLPFLLPATRNWLMHKKVYI